MAASDRPIWFVGDRADPAAAAIAQRLPSDRTRWVTARGDLPRFRLRTESTRPGLVIVHRAILGRGDWGRLARLRAWLGEGGRIILCVGPHARASEIERWLGLADAAIPDVLAATTIGRHLAATDRVPVATDRHAPLPNLAVVSSNHELRAMLAALLRAHRFAVAERAELEAATSTATPGPTVIVWDVPVLEPGWSDRLRRASTAGLGPIIALIGFLDARDARAASAAGAVAVLDLPVDAADLVDAVQHATQTRHDPAHPTPPAPRRSASHRAARRSTD